MGMIDITKLSGEVKAWANAADQNGDLMLNSAEKSVFDKLITEAGLTNDETYEVAVRDANKQDVGLTKKEKEKQEKTEAKDLDEVYKKHLGKDYNKEQIKSIENNADARVIRALKELRNNPNINPKELNGLISARPDVSKYSSVADYVTAFENWAKAVEDFAKESTIGVVKEQGETTRNAVDAATIKLTENMQVITDAAVEKLEGDLAEMTKQLEDDIKTGNAQIIQTVKTQTGRIISQIRTSEGRIIKVVRQESRIIQHEINMASIDIQNTVHEESGKVQNTVREESGNVQQTVRDEGEKTRAAQEQYAKQITDKLDEMPTKKSIAADIIKSFANLQLDMTKTGLELNMELLKLPTKVLQKVAEALE